MGRRSDAFDVQMTADEFEKQIILLFVAELSPGDLFDHRDIIGKSIGISTSTIYNHSKHIILMKILVLFKSFSS